MPRPITTGMEGMIGGIGPEVDAIAADIGASIILSWLRTCHDFVKDSCFFLIDVDGRLFFRQARYGSPDDARESDASKYNPHRRDEKEKTYTEDT
jgi:hypothetical protein